MKIKSVTSICKSNKTIILSENKSYQWISDGAAIYPMFGLPKMTKDQVLTMFDIPEDKRNGFYFEEKSFPKICFDDSVTDETKLERAKLSLCVGGVMLEPLKTSQGITYINERYLKPFDDAPIELYERNTRDGQTYIAIKEGFLLTGIITPYDPINEDFVNMLNDLYTLSNIAFENKESKGDEN